MSYFKLVFMAVVWSGVFPAVNILLRTMGVFPAVFLRFLAAAIVLLVVLRWREGPLRLPAGRDLAFSLGLGLLGITFYNTLFTAGLARVEASRAALIVPTNPAFTALFAALFLRERLGARRATGVALSVGGALWVLSRGDPRNFATLHWGTGELLLVLCIFAWSAYTLASRVALARLTPLALTTWVTLAGALPLAWPAWSELGALGQVSWQSWAAMAYLVIFGTVLPNLWYYEGVKALGAARAAQFINLVPPLAALESVLLLGEPATPALAVGALLVVAGLFLANRASLRAH